MKRKGFTLIELLAVIVILAIIALIATPMILNVVDESKKKASLVSAENYLNAIENYIALQDIDNYSVKINNNGIYKVKENTDYEVVDLVSDKYLNQIIKIKGEYPTDGYVKIDDKITYAEFTINGYLIECNENLICENKGIGAKSIEIEGLDGVDLTLDKEIQLTAKITPKNVTDKKVTWSVSNDDLFSISETGLFTIHGYGTVTISAKTSNGRYAEKTVKVSPKIKKYLLDMKIVIL